MNRASNLIKLMLLLFLMGISQQLHAQIKSGVRFGLNYPQISRLHPHESNGFHAGAYLKFSLAEIVVVEPGFQFSKRKFSTLPAVPANKVTLHHVDVPIIARLKILPLVHVFGGPQASILFSEKYRGTGNPKNGLHLPNYGWGAVAGIGLNLPAGINIQGSYDFGLEDLEYDGREINNRIFKISLGKDF